MDQSTVSQTWDISITPGRTLELQANKTSAETPELLVCHLMTLCSMLAHNSPVHLLRIFTLLSGLLIYGLFDASICLAINLASLCLIILIGTLSGII